jgi:hypothetical protein
VSENYGFNRRPFVERWLVARQVFAALLLSLSGLATNARMSAESLRLGAAFAYQCVAS